MGNPFSTIARQPVRKPDEKLVLPERPQLVPRPEECLISFPIKGTPEFRFAYNESMKVSFSSLEGPGEVRAKVIKGTIERCGDGKLHVVSPDGAWVQVLRADPYSTNCISCTLAISNKKIIRFDEPAIVLPFGFEVTANLTKTF